MTRILGPRLLLLVGIAMAAAPVTAQAPPPDGDWRTFRTEHFRVTFLERLEPMARQAAAVAERTHRVLSRELAEPPREVIDLVVTDHADYSNGLAGPFPSPRVLLFARPAAAGEFFARSWMELVVAHELVHIFHMEQSGRLGSAVRAVFGRLPVFWPVHPVLGSPSWNTEGLATHYETRLTGAGRVRSSIHDVIIRTAALEDAFPSLDELSAPSPVWPAGNRAYIYGGHFMAWIAERYGAGSHRALIDATAGSVWPTFLRFDHVAESALGRPFDALYAEWRAGATDSARATEQEVRAAGITATRPVAGRGPYALAPRVSPDGDALTFAASSWRSNPATRIVDLGTGRVRRLAERNQFGMILDPASWLPDGSGVVVAQLEYDGRYRLFSDLWRVDMDGAETRLTEGLRLAQPDVASDSRRVAAVQDHRAGMRLVLYDMRDGEARVIAEARPGEAFDRPRWSPDGRHVAAGRHADGRADLVVIDTETGAVTRVTDDTALDLAPAWSPDGRWLLWWSDRTGIPNIMAVEMVAGRPVGPVRQVTSVITGVVDPEVSPDGRTLYLAAYHADGWRIESLPFDPTAWRDAPPPTDRYGDAVLPAPDPPAPADGAARPYSPWPTLRPYYWLPTWEAVGSTTGTGLRFLGAALSGTDVVGRHSWLLAGAVDIDTGRLQGSGSWVYRGLGSADLFLAADRDWAVYGTTTTTDGVEATVLLREDELQAGVLFRRPRWRSTTALQVAGEVEHRALEGRELTRTELAAGGIQLWRARTLAGVSVSPGLGTARTHPFSISPEDGIGLGLGVGRWWDVDSGRLEYDELEGSLTGYLAIPLWGFANHVLAAHGAGYVREGDRAPVRSIGGTGEVEVLVSSADGSELPVRGFSEGDRWGTRGWSASAEWRFPIHMRNAPGRVLGFSLVSISGALFADAGNAWCTEADRDRDVLSGCRPADAAPLVSAGAELKFDLGIFHSSRARLAVGLAQRLQGGSGPVLYLGTGF
ncbi:MAG: hypothetical protein ACN0LA_05260 [Candidatus Longimicrobiales bacterium M2_2A_002]